MSNSAFVTLTAPSSAGKSYLLDFIRFEMGMPCFVSTTTRAPRANEVEGVDYFFISEEESRAIEARDGFAELAHYRGVRYGVTKEEFADKLSEGLAFLIVEPTGIDHYAKPALDAGATWFKYFIQTDLDVRITRLKNRMLIDLEDCVALDMLTFDSEIDDEFKVSTRTQNIVSSHFDRLRAAVTEEEAWKDKCEWTRILDGQASPKVNIDLIMSDITARLM